MPSRLSLYIAILISIIPLEIQSQSMSSGNMAGYGVSKLNTSLSYEYGTGAVNNAIALRAGMRLYKNKSFNLTLDGRYFSSDFNIHTYDKSGTYESSSIGIDGRKNWGQIGTTMTYTRRLFGKPFMGMAMINSDWGIGGFERVSGMFIGMWMLRVNRETQFGLGPLLLVNYGSKCPLFPVIMYRHSFSPKWQFDFYGSIINIKYRHDSRNSIAVGTEFYSHAFYFRPEQSKLPNRLRFSLVSYRPMLKYRYNFNNHFHIEARAGLAIKISEKVKSRNGCKEYMEFREAPSGFLQISTNYIL